MTNAAADLQAPVGRLRHFRPSDLAKIRAALNDPPQMLRVADAFSSYLMSLREPQPADIDEVEKIFAQLRSTGLWEKISARVLIAQLKDRIHTSLIEALTSHLPLTSDQEERDTANSSSATEALGRPRKFSSASAVTPQSLSALHDSQLDFHKSVHLSAQVYMVIDKGRVVVGRLEPSGSAITGQKFTGLPGKISAFDRETKTGVFFAGKSFGRLLFRLDISESNTVIVTSQAYQFSTLGQTPIRAAKSHAK